MSDLPVPFQGAPVTHAGGLAFLFAYLELLGASLASPPRRAPAVKHEVSVARLRAQGMTDDGLVWMLYHAHLRHRVPGAPRAAWPVDRSPTVAVALMGAVLD